MRIDSHQHLWRYNPRDYVWMSEALGALRRDFLPDERARHQKEVALEGAISVQARQMIEDTEWLLRLSERHPLIRGVVGWVPVADFDVRAHLERLSAHPALKGVRHVLHDEPNDSYMLREDFNAGIGRLKEYGLTYDVLIFERHLPNAIEFVDRHPNQVFIVDHIAKPRIKERLLSPWRERIGELAKRPNVYCKVSGMVTEANWAGWVLDDLRPYFEIALEAFGPARLMFGSDWPVVTLAAGYRDWVEAFRRLIDPLSTEEKKRMWGETAIEAYGLSGVDFDP